MTVQQLEERVAALEEFVEVLRRERRVEPPSSADEPEGDQDLIPGAEYPLVLDIPPQEVYSLKGRIVSVEEDHHEFSLSDAEWESLQLEDEDE